MRKISPYITEKSVDLAKQGKFTLKVDFNATRDEIRSLVKKYYLVNPISINIIKGKYLHSTKHRKQFNDRGVKKALVHLEKGKMIPGFEFETEDKKSKQAKKIDKNKAKKIKETKDVKTS
ncbi:MAG: 50S ribosomal protein L23 [bacterium]